MARDIDQIGGGAMRRIFSVLLPFAMAGAALFLAVPAASAASVHPAAATCTYGPCGGQGTVSVTVHYGSGGIITLSVTGTGFKPGESVQITVTAPTRSVGSLPAGSSGGIGGSVTLPGGYSAGRHGLTAVGSSSGTTASTTFTLTQSSGAANPCTASASTTHTSGVVLAAAYLSACSNQIPAAAGSPSAAPGVAGPAQKASELPFTGFNAGTYAAIGALAIAAGGGLVLTSRRRRREAWK